MNTCEEVQNLIHTQSLSDKELSNSHGLILGKSLITPQQIVLLNRIVRDGKVRDEKLDAWLVGGEPEEDGYKLVLRADGRSFGLASTGFPSDGHFILVGWYGTLAAAFLAM